MADALGANKTLEDCNRVAAQVKLAAYVLMPVRALMVAAPPRINMAVTIRHAITRFPNLRSENLPTISI